MHRLYSKDEEASRAFCVEKHRYLTRLGFLAEGCTAPVRGRIHSVALARNEERSFSQAVSIGKRDGEEPPAALDPVDREICEEELSEFVPKKIFYALCHIYRGEFDMNYPAAFGTQDKFAAETVWKSCDLEVLLV